jgi:antiviral defense system Shedu protein SduA
VTADADYVSRMKATRIYLSKEFQADTLQGKRPARFISRIFESGERDCMVEMRGEAVLRVTRAGRQQIKALFYVDDRSIDHILVQRFNTGPNAPQKAAYFSLRGDEVKRVVGLLKLIENGKLTGQDKFRIEESDLQDFAFSDDAARSLARSNPELIADIARNEVTKQDIIAVAYRRKVLERFRNMLEDDAFFGSEKARLSKSRDEDVWQALFEENPWILGYGLFYVFASQLDNRKLEQIVGGTSVAGRGKRADGLLRTRGRISSLCFVEIKTPKTPLLEKNIYRPDTWAVSRELAGTIAQAHRTVQVAEKTIGTRLEPNDEDGDPTGEQIFLFRPRSIAVVGSLEQFKSENGINEARYSSFELFRRQVSSPEVMTFDELYERARFIVEASESS